MRRVWPGPALLVCSLALVACGSGSGPGSSSGAAPASQVLFGFADGAFAGADAQQAADRAAGAGATVVRVLARWGTVQAAGPDAYDWSGLDDSIADLHARGIHPLIVVTSSPAWALDPADHCGGPQPSNLCPPAPRSLPAFAAFIRTLADRYKDDGLAGLEVWNEENIRTDWKTAAGPDPTRYARLLIAAASAARQADPGLTIVMGGLTSSSDDAAAGKISAPRFLDAVYRADARGSFDAIGVHPYPHPENAAAATADIAGFDYGLAQVRRGRDRNRDARKPLWITEVGYFTGMNRGAGNATFAQQGHWLLQLFDHARTQRDIAAFLIWRLRDDPNTPLEQGYGLLKGDWSPKPAYCLIADRFTPGQTPDGCPG